LKGQVLANQHQNIWRTTHPKVVACQSSEPAGPLFNPVRLSTTDYEKAKAAAPGWDIYYLEGLWRDWIVGKEEPKNPDAAFIAFCRKKYQQEGRS
jgi:hypothetical protein